MPDPHREARRPNTVVEWLRSAMARVGVVAGERKLDVHAIRHTYVTMMRRALGDVVLGQMVGHKSPQVTEGYDHAALDERMQPLLQYRPALDVVLG